jgi:ubiquinone/menaquinone biosynthesis C-methylase UbiE
MGRFDSTAETYAAHREPYSLAFFAAAADSLKLSKRETLIDLGTGPGVLALGFAPYVQRILGVDPEPAMIAEARKAAARAGVTFPVLNGRAEDLGADLGPFDVVTIGRALHWMEREPTLAALDRITAPDAHILICGCSSSKANPWRGAYDAVTHAWSGGHGEEHRRVHEHFFDSSRFARKADIRVEHIQGITAEALFARALTRSATSPAVLGEKVDAFKAELLAALTPFFIAGANRELLEARAWVFAAEGR